MGVIFKEIETVDEYNGFINYIESLERLQEMNPKWINIQDKIDLCRVYIDAWENK